MNGPLVLRCARPFQTPRRLLAYFDAQVQSRHLDLAARWLQSAGRGFYTIGSAGHESNAAVGRWRCGRPTRRCCTTARAASTPRARGQVAGLDRVARRAARRASRRRATRSPAAGTRSSATRRCTSSRRPRRSPRTCRGPSGSPSRSDRARALEPSSRRGRTTRSWCAASATPRSTTRRRSARSTPRPTARTRVRRLPAPVRLRGQRHRHQHPSPAGWVERVAARRGRASTYAAVDGARPGRRCSRRQPSAGRPGPRRSADRRAAPAHRAVHGPRRLGRRDRLPLAGARSQADYARDPLLATAGALVDARRR